jgi:hypothetical protein
MNTMPRVKKYSENDLMLLYGLKRFVGNNESPLLSRWLDQENTIELNSGEQYLFNLIFSDAQKRIESWNKEELTMRFIAFILKLAHLVDNSAYYKLYFKQTIAATVDTHLLKTKTDFIISRATLAQQPYFYFQVWKKYRYSTNKPIAQLLTAFLIAQKTNPTNHPVYGCTVTGKFWEFMAMSNKNYYISKSYDCTQEADLMKIIMTLRTFKYFLDAKCLD